MLREQEINDPSSCLNRAEEDEPIFVLRAKDKLATVVVNYWIGQSETLGLHPDRIQEAKEWVGKAREWQYIQEQKDRAVDTMLRATTQPANMSESEG